jgi:hypothetical protein
VPFRVCASDWIEERGRVQSPGKIVTALHCDYTISERVTAKAGESHFWSIRGVSILS